VISSGQLGQLGDRLEVHRFSSIYWREALAIGSEKEMPRIAPLGDVVGNINDYNTRYAPREPSQTKYQKRPVCPPVSQLLFAGSYLGGLFISLLMEDCIASACSIFVWTAVRFGFGSVGRIGKSPLWFPTQKSGCRMNVLLFL